jgi:hypothetical protein
MQRASSNTTTLLARGSQLGCSASLTHLLLLLLLLSGCRKHEGHPAGAGADR